jgi:uncharacterized protein YqkB
MTPDQTTLAIWGGGLLGGLIVGCTILFSVRGSVYEERQTLAHNLGQEYEKLYPSEGMAIEEAISTWKRLMEHQQAALKDAETSLVPALPRSYLETDLSSGSAQVHTDLQYLKQKAQRTQVRLPATLPFEEGLSADANQRLLQLAQLFLYRNVIDTCIEAGITKINSVKVETGPCDPQGKYAVLQCLIDLDMNWDRTSQLLADLNQTQNRKGYGVRNLSIEHDRSGNEKVSISVSLLTANNPAWGLRPDSAASQLPTAPAGGGTAPAGGSGNRFGRFGAN